LSSLKHVVSTSKNLRCMVINWTRSRDIYSRYVDPPRIYRRADLSVAGRIRFISVSQARTRWKSTWFRSQSANFVRATFRKNRIASVAIRSVCGTREIRRLYVRDPRRLVQCRERFYQEHIIQTIDFTAYSLSEQTLFKLSRYRYQDRFDCKDMREISGFVDFMHVCHVS